MEPLPNSVETPTRLELGVVIVNYCTVGLTLQCVASLLNHGIAPAESIAVVDNASPDGSASALQTQLPSGVRLVKSSVNGGFGAGVNLGVAALIEPLVLVLNPDTYFQRNQVDSIRDVFARHADLGVGGLKLINPDGSLQFSARRFYSLTDILARRTRLGQLAPLRRLVNTHLLKRSWQGDPFEADWVLGTGFVVRREAFEQVGRMDEGYFLYFEEVDLCARMWLSGWKVMALPQVDLVHEHQRQSAAGIWSRSGQTHLRSMVRFFRKFGVPWLLRPDRDGMRRAYERWRRQFGRPDARTGEVMRKGRSKADPST